VTFFSKTVAALSSKPFLLTGITEFSTEAKRHMHSRVHQRWSGNFYRYRSSAGHFRLYL